MITEKELIEIGFKGTYLPEDENGRIKTQFEYKKGKVLVGLADGENYILCLSDMTTDQSYACTIENVKNIFDVVDLCKLVNAP